MAEQNNAPRKTLEIDARAERKAAASHHKTTRGSTARLLDADLAGELGDLLFSRMGRA